MARKQLSMLTVCWKRLFAIRSLFPNISEFALREKLAYVGNALAHSFPLGGFSIRH